MDINVLEKVGKLLNAHQIKWGLGASSMLYFHGIVKKPADIDILVDEEDGLEVAKLLEPLSKYMKTDDGKGKYATRYFYEMEIDGQAIDLIGGYKILHQDWVYAFPKLKDMELEIRKSHGVDIYLTPLEDWFVAYLIMGDPKGRLPLIEAYYETEKAEKNGIRFETAYKQIQEKAPGDENLLKTLKQLI